MMSGSPGKVPLLVMVGVARCRRRISTRVARALEKYDLCPRLPVKSGLRRSPQRQVGVRYWPGRRRVSGLRSGRATPSKHVSPCAESPLPGLSTEMPWGSHYAGLKLGNVLFQCRHGCSGSAPQTLLAHFPEPTFHRIEPRAAGGSVVDVESWMIAQPLTYVGVFVAE